VSSQAFLLTGYAILLNAPVDLRSQQHASDHALLMKLIPMTSIAVTLLLWLGIFAALRAMGDLRSCAMTHPGYEASHIQGGTWTRKFGLAAPALVPLVFLITWGLLLFR
jgi:protein-S-isoprenylcysteine O-methyltransferase Ste14